MFYELIKCIIKWCFKYIFIYVSLSRKYEVSYNIFKKFARIRNYYQEHHVFMDEMNN